MYRVPPLLLLRLCTGVVAAAAAVVRHHVPDGKHCCWFVESDSIQWFFLFIQTRLFLTYVPLGSTVVFTA